jgi:hypothetical protein
MYIMAVGDRSSETQCHPIDMNINAEVKNEYS